MQQDIVRWERQWSHFDNADIFAWHHSQAHQTTFSYVLADHHMDQTFPLILFLEQRTLVKRDQICN